MDQTLSLWSGRWSVRRGRTTVVGVEPDDVVVASGLEAFAALDRLAPGFWVGWCAFELGHADPTQRPVLLGYSADPSRGPREKKLFVSPIAVRWEPGGETEEVIDCERHGYDGEQDANCTITGEGRRRPWR